MGINFGLYFVEPFLILLQVGKVCICQQLQDDLVLLQDLLIGHVIRYLYKCLYPFLRANAFNMRTDDVLFQPLIEILVFKSQVLVRRWPSVLHSLDFCSCLFDDCVKLLLDLNSCLKIINLFDKFQCFLKVFEHNIFGGDIQIHQ